MPSGTIYPIYTLRALSLWQPWASLVAWGEKRLETRHWSTSYRGPIAIHATKIFPFDARETCLVTPFRRVLAEHGIRHTEDLPRGAIIAVCDLVSCTRTDWKWTAPEFVSPLSCYPLQERQFGDFSAGRYAWKLDNVRALLEPIPCRGAMGLWTPDSELAAAIQTAVNQLEVA